MVARCDFAFSALASRSSERTPNRVQFQQQLKGDIHTDETAFFGEYPDTYRNTRLKTAISNF